MNPAKREYGSPGATMISSWTKDVEAESPSVEGLRENSLDPAIRTETTNPYTAMTKS